jgi:uncharacterized membrane protein YphA (DoxX/SURF4 family)
VYGLSFDYPPGRQGLGLLILRVGLAFFLITEGVIPMINAPGATSGAGASAMLNGLASMAFGLCAAAGLLTPIVQMIVAVVESVSAVKMLHALAWAAFHASEWQRAVLEVAIALALVLTGPGAYSLDNRLFGRREIVVRSRANAAPSRRSRSPRK